MNRILSWVEAWFTTHQKTFWAAFSGALGLAYAYTNDEVITEDEWWLIGQAVVTAFIVWLFPNTPKKFFKNDADRE